MQNDLVTLHSSDVTGIKACKETLRKNLRAARHQCYQREGNFAERFNGQAQSHFLAELLSSFGLLSANQRLLSYFPMEQELKIQNHLFECEVMLPKCAPNRSLAWSDLRAKANKNKFGIFEADWNDCRFFCDLLPRFTVLLAPCLAVDHKGFRLGYGGGYYDRFLGTYRDQVISVSCVNEQDFLEAIPCENHDIPIDIVITNKRICVVSSSEYFLQKISKLKNF